MIDGMGVTGNAILLLGYLGGLVSARGDDGMYAVIEIEAETGTQVLEHRVTGNTYRVTVVQLAGAE